MFTGLIQAIGQVRGLVRQGGAGSMTIASSLAAEDLQLGESIAVNGVCLTVTGWDSGTFTVDVSPETLRCTTLGELRPTTAVNLERALRLSDRLGGHLVSGHIDTVGTVVRRQQDQNAVLFEFSAPATALRYVVEKGSVAIDGISLTVNQLQADAFSVSIIPHSLAQTCLKDRRPGDRVNIETDLLGRYVERLLGGRDGQAAEGKLSREFLAKNGFL
ncbi:MAG: riboflavin synthase [Pelovirga sp.]